MSWATAKWYPGDCRTGPKHFFLTDIPFIYSTKDLRNCLFLKFYWRWSNNVANGARSNYLGIKASHSSNLLLLIFDDLLQNTANRVLPHINNLHSLGLFLNRDFFWDNLVLNDFSWERTLHILNYSKFSRWCEIADNLFTLVLSSYHISPSRNIVREISKCKKQSLNFWILWKQHNKRN